MFITSLLLRTLWPLKVSAVLTDCTKPLADPHISPYQCKRMVDFFKKQEISPMSLPVNFRIRKISSTFPLEQEEHYNPSLSDTNRGITVGHTIREPCYIFMRSHVDHGEDTLEELKEIEESECEGYAGCHQRLIK